MVNFIYQSIVTIPYNRVSNEVQWPSLQIPRNLMSNWMHQIVQLFTTIHIACTRRANDENNIHSLCICSKCGQYDDLFVKSNDKFLPRYQCGNTKILHIKSIPCHLYRNSGWPSSFLVFQYPSYQFLSKLNNLICYTIDSGWNRV